MPTFFLGLETKPNQLPSEQPLPLVFAWEESQFVANKDKILNCLLDVSQE